MTDNIRKTNEGSEYFNSRLDEVRMGDDARLMAKVHLARAEAMADALAAVGRGALYLLRALVVRPFRRLTSTQTWARRTAAR